MKVGFIGLGRMGQAMAHRLIDGGHEVGVYNRTAEKLKPLIEHGAKPMTSIKAAATFGDAVFTMLTDDAAVTKWSSSPAESGTRCRKAACTSVPARKHRRRRKTSAVHKEAGQVLIASPVLGRPEVVAAGSGRHGARRRKETIDRCRPLFTAIAGRLVEAGDDPLAATAIKIANNFVLGCAIESMGEGFALIPKYGVTPETFYGVMTEGLFACGAYKVYGKLIVDEKICPTARVRSTD